ncbi:C-terminal domain of homeodomain 1-domain-containing protein [Mycena maculata]|uniref:C-terminal domain of homeodomain 1-domain-containing protein n=1 Tax=Mycena maculata TaxID=230809 RepID=A0AAD7NAA8_9AGAR|nr:C-terminal domain of homeodomain 1-domain-containing protein [Mycena maculata]
MSTLSVHQRLVFIEAEFLQTVSKDDLAAAASFEQKWSQLRDDLETASRTNALDEDTKTLAHNIASTVNIFANSFISMRTQSENISTTLVNQLESVFDDMNLEVHVAEGSSDSSPPPASRPDPSSLPPYIEPAYRWLLKHLHNPYPNKDVKQRIADETGSSLKRVSEWFVAVRQRMGWTLMLREEFGRKRIDMVDAAHRFFISEDRFNPLPDYIRGRFVQIEASARDMYGAKFVPSALSNKLTAAVKDLTPELQEKARAERLKKLDARRAAASLGVYPSPVLSGASSPISDAGASTSGHKRSSSEASDVEYSSSKRSRTDDGPNSAAFTLPSPPYSGASSPVASRKRRLSDADAPSAKRPRNRAASDPVPVIVTLAGTPELLADWFSSDPEGETDLFNPGQLLDIKFFDPAEYEFEEPAQPVLQEVTTLPQTTLEQSETSSFDIPPDIQNMFDFPNFAADYSQSPSFVSYDSYQAAPAVYEPPSFMEPYVGGQNYDEGYLTRESVAESLAFHQMPPSHDDSYSFPDGKASGNLINVLFEQHHQGGNEYTMYQHQPAAYATS